MFRKILEKKYWTKISEFAYTRFKEEDLAKFSAEYRELFGLICNYWFGIKKKKTVDEMFEDMCQGNWKRLHMTEEEEKNFSIPFEMENIKSDLLYCSDRMSWDRLMRIHWRYQNIKRMNRMAEEDAW